MAAAQYAMMPQMPEEVESSLFMPVRQDGGVPAMPPCGHFVCDGAPRAFFLPQDSSTACGEAKDRRLPAGLGRQCWTPMQGGVNKDLERLNAAKLSLKCRGGGACHGAQRQLVIRGIRTVELRLLDFYVYDATFRWFH